MKPERYSQIRELFQQACELDEASRSAFLDQQCGDDAELRSEVESLLKCDITRTIVAAPTMQDVAVSTAQPITRSQAPLSRALLFEAGGILSRFFRRPVYRYLTIAIVSLLLVGLGLWMYDGMRRSLRQLVASRLQGVLDADVEALTLWLSEKRSDVTVWAGDPQLRQGAERLVGIGRTTADSRSALLASAELANLRIGMEPYVNQKNIVAYAIVDQSGLIVAAHKDEKVGVRLNAGGVAVNAPVFEGKTIFLKPHPDGAFSNDNNVRYEIPMIWVGAPIRDEDENVIASLSFGMRADDQFTRILAVAQLGDTGETYAFDENGLLLSDSRFDEELVAVGLIPDEPGARSIFTVQVRDPGGDLAAGFKTDVPLEARRFTEMAAMAVAGQDGINMDGYRNYRGVKVVGAWKWLPEYGFGVATEAQHHEVYKPLRYPIIAFWIRYGFLAVLLLGLWIAAYRIVRLSDELGEAQQLGQYTLEEKIGEGGMGVVYRARHAMLRRATAIKLLHPDQVSDEAIARFQREVLLASQLTHPNTIEIYDFGRNSDGVFYYAMEYLPGLSLAQLSSIEGPLPAGRVVYILKQLCGSLSEAHSVGLVHRDVKPQNVMLCQRGGQDDFVKVLDFGLVKEINTADAQQLTAPMTLAGTPMYMAPERIVDSLGVDARSDLYSVGAVGYKLLTSSDVFECKTDMDALHHAMNIAPRRPSETVASGVPDELDQLIVDCLAKDPADRPQTAREIINSLDRIQAVAHWSDADAHLWWEQYGSQNGGAALSAAGKPLASKQDG